MMSKLFEFKIDDSSNYPINIEESSKRSMKITEKIEITSSDKTNDYNKLKNIPTLNGQPIKGDINESDPTVPAWAKENNKPQYTPKEIGAVNAEDALSFEEIDEMFNSIFKEISQ